MAVTKGPGLGISPGYYEHEPWLFFVGNKRNMRPKELPGCSVSQPTNRKYPGTWNLSDSPEINVNSVSWMLWSNLFSFRGVAEEKLHRLFYLSSQLFLQLHPQNNRCHRHNLILVSNICEAATDILVQDPQQTQRITGSDILNFLSSFWLANQQWLF